MTFGQFLSLLRARWKVAVLVFCVAVGGTLLVSLLLPKQYTASASVVVDAKPDAVSAIVYSGGVSPAFMATQIDIILSDRVARRVVKNLKLAQNPQIAQQWRDESEGKGSIDAWIAGFLQKKMDVKPSRESNVITVAYSSPDPNFAAGLANAFVQAYVDTLLEMRVNPARQFSDFFDTRAKDARDALERAQTKLSAYQQQNGIIGNDERLDIETARLNDLSTQLVTVQAISAESTSRNLQAMGASGDKLQDVTGNPLITQLKSDLSRAEGTLQQLNSRYGENHPSVIEAKAQIKELRSRLDAETRRITGGVGITDRINRAREAQVRSELEAQRAKVLHLKAARDEVAVMQRDVENAQRTYDSVVARQNQSSIESQTTQSSAAILSQASAPLDPSSPKLALNMVIAIFAGTLLGIGIALLLELANRRVRAADDASLATGLPVLGVMPPPLARRSRQRLTLAQERLLGRLPAPRRGT